MVSSLQEICGVKVAILISNHPEVKEQIFSSSLNALKQISEYERWTFALQRESSNFLINIPPGLARRVPCYLVPLIGFQMLKWAEFHESNFNLPLNFSCNFIKSSYFTSKGIIEEEMAARDLVKESSLSPLLHFKIACYYFMSDIIPPLWKQFYHEPDMKEMFIEDFDETIMMWSKHLEKTQEFSLYASSETEHFLTTVFHYGIARENLSALKYYCKKVPKFWKIFSFAQNQRARNRGLLHTTIYDYSLLFKLREYQNLPWCEMLLSLQFEKIVNILVFFLKQMKRKEIKQFMNHCNISYTVLRMLLCWPYQHLFLNMADSGLFFKLERNSLPILCGVSDYYFLSKDIIELIENPILGMTYNYRLLLKDFLIKSPFDFKASLRIQSDHSGRSFVYFISPTLLRLRNFTSEDEYNYKLILKHATSQTKTEIFNNRGEEICQELISRGNFKLANFFLDSLSLNKKNIKMFKKSLAEYYFVDVVMKEENIHLADQYVNWIVNPEENEEFKKEILTKVFKFSKVTSFILQSKISLTFLNVILQWLLNTSEEITKWKLNGVSDKSFGKTFMFERFDPQMFDRFLGWICNSKEGISDMKREILLQTLPAIVIDLFDENRGLEVDEDYVTKVLYLCSDNKDLTKEFVKVLHDHCKNFVEQNMCLLCCTSNNVYLNEDNSELYCSLHCIPILSLEDVDCVCSYILKSADDFLKVHTGE